MPPRREAASPIGETDAPELVPHEDPFSMHLIGEYLAAPPPAAIRDDSDGPAGNEEVDDGGAEDDDDATLEGPEHDADDVDERDDDERDDDERDDERSHDDDAHGHGEANRRGEDAQRARASGYARAGYPARGAHNPAVTSNSTTSKSVRPGVDLPGGPDHFLVERDTQRYVILASGKFKKWDRVLAGKKLHVNPAAPRQNAKGTTYVLTWSRNGKRATGPGWIRASAFGALAGAITGGARQLAQQRWPRTITGPQVLRAKANRRELTSAPLGEIIKALAKHQVREHISADKPDSADRVDHYLIRPGITGRYYNVVLNLPHPSAPPVAIDVALPGAPFFVLEYASSPTFATGSSKAGPPMTWAFGFLGYKRGGRDAVPDATRCGWVPLAVLI